MSTRISCKKKKEPPGDLNKEVDDSKKRGRPFKKIRGMNGGRKKLTKEEISNASDSTHWRLAKEIFNMSDPNVLKKLVTMCSPTKSNKEVIESETPRMIAHTEDSALAFIMETKMSKGDYIFMAADIRERVGESIFPCYDKLKNSKIACQPEGIVNNEVEVCVPLQQIFDITAERLMEALQWNNVDVILMLTLGFDSSSGHVNPNQSFNDESNTKMETSQNLFVTCFTIIKAESTDGILVWINPTPHSIRFCRPVRLCLEKEDTEATKREYERLMTQLSFLHTHRFSKIKISYDVYHTLFDGKCCNTIVDNGSTIRCFICGVTAFHFQDENENFTPLSPLHLKLGQGLLHEEIKCFEYCLHLAYKKKVKRWDIGKKDKILEGQVKEEKERVLKRLFDATGIIADRVLQGHGTTNTGNNARRCFSEPEVFAEALEIDLGFVQNIALILSLFRCKLNLNMTEMRKLCKETYTLHNKIFYWARMKPTVHKLLIHGCDIADQFPLPIGYYSEDASESWHKLYRKYMVDHARQDSREHRILDVFHRAIYMSDPKLSLYYIEKRLKTNKTNISDEMKKYLKLWNENENEVSHVDVSDGSIFVDSVEL